MADSRFDYRLEICSTILLALTALASAWCVYQSTLWGGIQTFRLNEASMAGRNSAAKIVYSNQLRQVDVSLFMQFMEATFSGNQKLADFYRTRFRDELKPAAEAWLATRPLDNPDAPLGPFRMKEYVLKSDAEAEEYTAMGQGKLEEAKQANQNSDNYVMITVIFAFVLFFCGIAAKFDAKELKTAILAMASLMFVFALTLMAGMPITFD